MSKSNATRLERASRGNGNAPVPAPPPTRNTHCGKSSAMPVAGPLELDRGVWLLTPYKSATEPS
jgi:hypothetical protein